MENFQGVNRLSFLPNETDQLNDVDSMGSNEENANLPQVNRNACRYKKTKAFYVLPKNSRTTHPRVVRSFYGLCG
jgi:hypothetical protein